MRLNFTKRTKKNENLQTKKKKMEVELPKIGDKIKVKVDGEKQGATCMGYDEDGRPVFLFDNIFTELSHDEAVDYCKERGWFLPSEKNLKEWELMQDYRYRVAGLKGGLCADWWWLTDRVNGVIFAYVDSLGHAASANASYSLGVRPAFKI